MADDAVKTTSKSKSPKTGKTTGDRSTVKGGRRTRAPKATPKTREDVPVYQIKITLKDSKPPIWRRLLVPASMNLADLHLTIQYAMGWTNSHLFHFMYNDMFYSIPSPEDWEPVEDARRLRLDAMALKETDKFLYEYDFGDSWLHEILLEKILPPDPAMKAPVCIKGRRACPEEDVGGIWGYESFVEAMLNPNHPEHGELREWWGGEGEFDPAYFNLEEVNQRLRGISLS